MKFKTILFTLLLFQFWFQVNYSQENKLVGKIEGFIIDSYSKSELIGANVLIVNSNIGGATDIKGKFVIESVPVGNYSLKFSFLGYNSVVKTDIIVRSNRITTVNCELNSTSIEADEVVVQDAYFQNNGEQQISNINFSREEIRRAPGSAGDVSRILMSLPSVAQVNDQSNTLAVRGGSPIENTFYIDNIEIPNINHFPSQGASGGAIGMLNVDFIEDVNFFTGGFSAIYGNKLSSIMEISLREGNRNEFDGQLDLNFSGFGGIIEGPISESSSFMISARRSYIDFLIKMINVGSSIAPTYGDVEGKIVFDIDKNNKIMLVGVFGDDHMSSDQQNAIENKMVFYGDQDIYQTTIGVNWRSLWSSKGYSNTLISFNSMKFIEDFYETGSAALVANNRSNEMFYQLRNINYYQFNKQNSAKFGIEAKHIIADFNNWYSEYSDAIGNPVESFTIKNTNNSNILAAFGNYIIKPTNRIELTLGARSDYFSYANKLKFSPRFSLSYLFSDETKLNISTGLFYQALPSKLLVLNETNKNLSIPVSQHYIIGIEQLLTESTLLKFEIYQKNYSKFPMDPNQPGIFLIDEVYYNDGVSFNTNKLLDNGEAQTKGAELTIQKKLAKDFYGLIGASYFNAKYKGLDNKWKNRIYDNQFIFNIEGGYKPNYSWEFSLRWIYAGGRPYTPFNASESVALNRGVLDENKINSERYLPYHSLNVRVDKRFAFSNSNLVIYLSVWNVYDRKNEASIYWNQTTNQQDVVYQWGMLPIFGVEYEF
ncbi:MAG: TonB-dependent receptor [Bacteroidetes bacterium]|nr:TonB-dependent receptor [Bacteroidota bacterium]MBU1115251.1 TonB-dependent receptor [Bacteroidota bacterium]MBU1797269.1 TonB-dependent receptor [Bacteroidota bacterium]